MVLNAFDAIQKNFKSAVGKKYSWKNVRAVWSNVTKQISENIFRGKATCIDGLGTFTLSEWKIHSGGKTCRQILCPIFILSKKLSDFYNLRVTKCYSSGKIPTKPLNITEVASASDVQRNVAEEIITEVIQAFVKLLGANFDSELSFNDIGKVRIINKAVEMEFDDAFVQDVKAANECNHDVEICVKRFYTFPYNSGNYWTV